MGMSTSGDDEVRVGDREKEKRLVAGGSRRNETRPVG
jgi:hypothetical protein